MCLFPQATHELMYNWRIQLERSSGHSYILTCCKVRKHEKVSMDLRAGGNPAYKDTVCQECQRFPWKTMALFLHDHLQWFRRTSNCLKPQSLDVLCAKTLEHIRLSWMIFPDFYLLYFLLLWKVMLLKDDQNKSSNWFVVLGFASRHGGAVEGNWLLADNRVDVLKDEFRTIVRFCHQIWSLTVLVALKIIPNSGTPQLISIKCLLILVFLGVPQFWEPPMFGPHFTPGSSREEASCWS